MSWRLAESLKQLREQVNAKYPNRDRSSDGTIGDAAHSQRKSDHNPNAAGVVTAIDIDRDLMDGHDGRELVAALQASRDPRIKYIIFERKITVKGDISQWKPYTGVNAHNHHLHISVSSDPRLYDDARAWVLDGGVRADEGVRVPLRRGDKGDDVRELQVALHMSQPDGDFGPKTEAAVKNFQVANRLTVDGVVGAATRRALGLPL